jgi:hypothetical protein
MWPVSSASATGSPNSPSCFQYFAKPVDTSGAPRRHLKPAEGKTRLMVRLLIVIGLMLLLLGGCASSPRALAPLSSEAITDSELILQQRSLLWFEQEAVCEAHIPCVRHFKDEHYRQNPKQALDTCKQASSKIDRIGIPSELPSWLQDELYDIKKSLKHETDTLGMMAENQLKGRSALNMAVSLAVPRTGQAFSRLRQIHQHYRLPELDCPSEQP